MRDARIKEEGPGYYHVVSRVVDRRMVFDDPEKERFCRIMRATESMKKKSESRNELQRYSFPGEIRGYSVPNFIMSRRVPDTGDGCGQALVLYSLSL